jgi:hypothetical protein
MSSDPSERFVWKQGDVIILDPGRKPKRIDWALILALASGLALFVIVLAWLLVPDRP